MATETLTASFIAGAAISAGELVKLSAYRTVIKSAGTGEAAIGVALENIANGATGTILLKAPMMKGIAGAALDPADAIYVGSSGKFQKAITTGTRYALVGLTSGGSGSAADGDKIDVVVA